MPVDVYSSFTGSSLSRFTLYLTLYLTLTLKGRAHQGLTDNIPCQLIELSRTEDIDTAHCNIEIEVYYLVLHDNKLQLTHLPFTTIVYKQSASADSLNFNSDIDGRIQLKLRPGEYQNVFRFVGCNELQFEHIKFEKGFRYHIEVALSNKTKDSTPTAIDVSLMQCAPTVDRIFDKKVYTVPDQMPVYLDDPKGLEHAFTQKLKHTEEYKYRVQSCVYITFIIDEYGSLRYPEIDNFLLTKAPTPIEKIILKELQNAQRWQAGMCDGKAVPVRMRVAFQMYSEQKTRRP